MDKKRIKILFILGILIFIVVFIAINILIKQYENEALNSSKAKEAVSDTQAPAFREGQERRVPASDMESPPPLEEGEPET
jgi:flagellar biosynthesis/type III secretory pathway M-ring protein FliF/YscJ